MDTRWILISKAHNACPAIWCQPCYQISIDLWVRITSPNTEYKVPSSRYELPVFKNVKVIHGKWTCGDFEEQMKIRVGNSLFICHMLFHIFSIDPIHIQET